MSMESVAPISPRCPTCGRIMDFTNYSPTSESTIYHFQCGGDGDRLTWQAGHGATVDVRPTVSAFGGKADTAD